MMPINGKLPYDKLRQLQQQLQGQYAATHSAVPGGGTFGRPQFMEDLQNLSPMARLGQMAKNPLQTIGSSLKTPVGMINAGARLLSTDFSNPESVGGTAGSVVGTALGSAIPIPVVGPMIGSFLGEKAGGAIGKLFGDDEEEEQRKKAEKEQKIAALRNNLSSLAQYYNQGNMARANMGQGIFG